MAQTGSDSGDVISMTLHDIDTYMQKVNEPLADTTKENFAYEY